MIIFSLLFKVTAIYFWPPNFRLSQPTYNVNPPIKAATIRVHRRHLLLLLSPLAHLADT